MAQEQRKFSIIGNSVHRVDGVDKVTGKAKYVADLIIPGLSEGKFLRSPYAHARIRSIDTTEAEAMPGVLAVLTSKDFTDISPYMGRGKNKDHPIIALDRAIFAGQPVAAVAAVDRATAEEALSKINVDYEELPAVINVEEAMADGAPLVHSFAEKNICFQTELVKGDVEKAFAEADEIFEDSFEFPMIYHYSMEPHTSIAQVDSDGITIWASTGHPFGVRQEVAEVFQRSALQSAGAHEFRRRGLRQQVRRENRALGCGAGAESAAAGAGGANFFRGDGDLPPSRDQVQGQNRREKGRHVGGETSGNFSQHRRLCGDRSDGYRKDAHAHSRAVSLSEPENQFVLHLYQYGFRRVVPFHRRAADGVGDRIADGYHRRRSWDSIRCSCG